MTVTRSLIGRRVTDGQRVGILVDIYLDHDWPSRLIPDPPTVTRAFVRPVGGGIEWTISRHALNLCDE